MINTILSNSSHQNSSGIAHILSRIDYYRLNTGLAVAKWKPNQVHKIVLFEYVHSGIYDTIAEIERIPGTTRFIHDVLKDNEVENALRSLFADKPNMKLYSRRKIDDTKTGSESLTKYREYVLQVSLESPPSTILSPEDYYEDRIDFRD
jgi:hypothetical protein